MLNTKKVIGAFLILLGTLFSEEGQARRKARRERRRERRGLRRQVRRAVRRQIRRVLRRKGRAGE